MDLRISRAHDRLCTQINESASAPEGTAQEKAIYAYDRDDSMGRVQFKGHGMCQYESSRAAKSHTVMTHMTCMSEDRLSARCLC